MIRSLYALKLARTKLKTKRLLLAVTIAISALLFGLIIASILIVTGVSRSADSYLKTTLDGKYLVTVSPVIPNDVMGFGSMVETPSDELRAHLLDLQHKYIASQKKLASQYGTLFDENEVDPIVKPSPFGNKDKFGNVREVINRESPAYQLYVAELQDKWLASTNATTKELQRRADAGGATAYYQTRDASISFMDTKYLPDGKEDLSKAVSSDIPGSEAIQNSSYTFIDQSLIKRYILPENQTRRENKTAIPVVLTKDEAVKYFGKKIGLTDEPNNPSDKIVWMKTLQEKINGHTYQACYRNGPEINRIQETMRRNQSSSGSESAQEPTVTYSLPTDVCAPALVEKDSRTTAQKEVQAAVEAYQKAAGTYTRPAAQLLTFQIVGIMPPVATQISGHDDLPSLVGSILSSQYPAGVRIPNQLYDKLPKADRHEDILLEPSSVRFGYSSEKLAEKGVVPAIVSFPSADKARAFINMHTCQGYDSEKCQKPWISQVYGPANYLLIDDLSNRVSVAARRILPIAVAVAAIVMSFTMARVIIDSRRETAVFRALGAKRKDIVYIYLIYSVLVASLIAAYSFVVGFTAAFMLQIIFGDEVTSYVKVAYGIFDESGPFRLVGVSGTLLVYTIAVILIVGIIAIIPPLIRNVRRNPIRDMRDDG